MNLFNAETVEGSILLFEFLPAGRQVSRTIGFRLLDGVYLELAEWARRIANLFLGIITFYNGLVRALSESDLRENI
jgi:hypothetical protein